MVRDALIAWLEGAGWDAAAAAEVADRALEARRVRDTLPTLAPQDTVDLSLDDLGASPHHDMLAPASGPQGLDLATATLPPESVGGGGGGDPMEGLVAPPPGRYELLGLLAEGGMGEVHRVRDTVLRRDMVLKRVKVALVDRPGVVARFVAEAQATAQLQHPGIVPVHDLGLWRERPFYTMEEIRGETLEDAILALHRMAADAHREAALRRLVESFERVCRAVAYAHARGVLHRDLKPSNVMLGPWGEVRVVDWGLASAVDDGTGEPHYGDDSLRVSTARSGSQRTRLGRVLGTPGYMSPEQARGEVLNLDARSDVFALGCILYALLVGAGPYADMGGEAAVQAAALGSVPRVPRGDHPLALVLACEQAMAPDRADRFATTEALADAVRAWLDDVRQAADGRRRALAAVGRAEVLREAVKAQRAEADAARARASAATVAPLAPVAGKRVAWALDDEAIAAGRAVARLELERVLLLQTALQHDPTCAKAHAVLAREARQAHMSAEASRNVEAAELAALRLRTHLDGLADGHAERAAHERYLTGRGQLTVDADRPARVMLYRYVEQDRRLAAEPVAELGPTPASVEVEAGSYLAVIRGPGCAEARVPARVGRSVASSTGAVALLPQQAVSDACYVPAGAFIAGGDPEARRSLPRQELWCHGFVIDRHPVTNAGFIAFLDDLVAQGREDEALDWAPRGHTGKAGQRGPVMYEVADGRFATRVDADGDKWGDDWPAMLVTWHAAHAYANWREARDGLPWRLPCELEWEKAARGVDGRLYPWGDRFDPSWCATRVGVSATLGRALPLPVTAFPGDTSPYGVRGMSGMIREWCLDRFRVDGPQVRDGRVWVPEAEPDAAGPRSIRGECWGGSELGARSAARNGGEPKLPSSYIGFRLVRPV